MLILTHTVKKQEFIILYFLEKGDFLLTLAYLCDCLDCYHWLHELAFSEYRHGLEDVNRSVEQIIVIFITFVANIFTYLMVKKSHGIYVKFFEEPI